MNNEKSSPAPGRALPEHTIGNTVFVVDVAKAELRKKTNYRKRISFHDMDYEGTHYSLWYDDKQTQLAKYKVPNMVRLDPEGMALKYNKTFWELEGKTDFEVIVDQAFYKERIGGRQPTIQIGEHKYYVDFHWGMLRPHIDHDKQIKHWPQDLVFDELESINHDTAYQFFFDAKKQSVFEFDEDILLIPPDIFLVTIPAEEKLDPFAYARKWNEPVEQYLMKNPPQRHFEASLVPAGQTFLKDMVEENRKRFKEDDGMNPNDDKAKKKK
ncbi:MAG: hypothetical protein BGO55_08770 [Sphingobacteriales bacterium 50-39]|nr:hypothetical protein [Sphingobacteriales bacterium]OJW59355.1 MAG: hypothetical protein BGO55_08770 [Sphingobacteriales bacterium 50-39]